MSPGFPIFPRKPPVEPPRQAVCARCKEITKMAHSCRNAACGWFYCGSCGVMTERPTGRSMRYGGPGK
jgi:late competence protein required for DNA uptake (superfamily II DNA/RNA helicase)